MRNTHPPFHVSFSAFRNPSHSWKPWETPKPFFMLHFSLPKLFPPHSWESWEIPTPVFMLHFMDCSWEPWETPKPLFMLRFWPFQTLPTLRLGAMKHATPFSCFIFWPSQTIPTTLLGTILSLPKPFPPYSCEPWSTQPPFSCFIFGLPRPFPPHAWEPWSAQTPFHALFLAFPSPLPTPLLWAMKHPTPVFMLHFWPSQTLPTPRLGTMKHPNPFSCFILSFPKPFPPYSWEPWSTQTPFDASCFMVPKSGVGGKTKNEAWKGVWVLGWVWEGLKWSMKRGLGVSHGS